MNMKRSLLKQIKIVIEVLENRSDASPYNVTKYVNS
jgi:hypothetical protein